MAQHISLLLRASLEIAAMSCQVCHCYVEKNWQQRSNSNVLLTFLTSSKDSNMSMLGWWMVHTTVLPVSTVFLTVLITIAAALASKPEVGSSINIIEGFATSSTAIVSRFLCSVDRPLTPGSPTNACLNGFSSTSSMTSSMNICKAILIGEINAAFQGLVLMDI